MNDTRVEVLYFYFGILFVLFQATDSFMTMWAVGNGYYETNPLMRSLIGSTGTWILPLVKILPSILAVICIAWIFKKLPRLIPVGTILMAASAGFYYYVFWHNYIQLGV